MYNEDKLIAKFFKTEESINESIQRRKDFYKWTQNNYRKESNFKKWITLFSTFIIISFKILPLSLFIVVFLVGLFFVLKYERSLYE